jgi:hypothetical protein
MKMQKGSVLLGAFVLLLIPSLIVSWGVNAYKLTKCDFIAPFRCEIIHVVGLIPAMSVATVWVDTDIE